jgi:MFS family permease
MQKSIQSLRKLYREYPRPFWLLILVTFIDSLGGALLFPFFTLYLTRRFEVSLSEAAVIFAIYAGAAFFGTTFGGALSDRMGRKWMLVISLIASSISAVSLGVADSLGTFFTLAFIVGIFSTAGNPAHQAMVADLLPEGKRTQGFGLLRVAYNLSAAIGPAIGGFIATRSYLALFITDAVISLAAAAFVLAVMPETKPAPAVGAAPESMARTFAGFLRVFADWRYMLYLLVSAVMVLVYMNFSTTLGVYLRDVHGTPEQGYGLLLSLNAAMVVVLQFPITRWVKAVPPFILMSAGTVLYAVGFGMYGFVTVYALFAAAMVIITLGEMLVAPSGQALVASFAPADMRGRYLAIYGYAWGIPMAFGPMWAGAIMEGPEPRWLWYLCGIVGLAAAAGFAGLHLLAGRKQIHPAAEESG